MQFFKIVLLILFLSGAALASDLKDMIMTRESGSCKTNNLSYSAMKFYKIPLLEKIESNDLYLRILLFFNQDNTLSLRLTTQALLGCQTLPSGDVACSYRPVNDQWIKTTYSIVGNIEVPELGIIELRNPLDTNRGFEITFKDDFERLHLRGQKFIGGMVAVNFDQNGINTINICKE